MEKLIYKPHEAFEDELETLANVEDEHEDEDDDIEIQSDSS